VLGPQGRRGEVAAELHTSFPERFVERRHLSALASDGSRRELQLEQHWFHKGHVILKFAGVESISDADRLSGMELQIREEQRAELEAGAVYISDLVGCSLFDRGGLIGTVAGVRFGAGEAPLLVVRRGEGEFLVPYAEAFLTNVSFQGRRIEMKLPEGLLELQAPLNEDEKRQQKLEANETRKAGERRRGHNK
jgi:16S rRNA processing protein RimM